VGINNSDAVYYSESLLLGSLGQVAPPLRGSVSFLIKQINVLACFTGVLRSLIN